MNTLDVIFLAITGASVIYSLIRGLIKEIFSLLAIILGFFGASYGYSAMAHWLKRWITNETLIQILGFALLFLLIALGISLLGILLSRLAHKGGLGWADRMGGAAFGVLKAFLLIAIVLLVLTAFLPPKSTVLIESELSPAVLAVARGLSYVVPEKFHDLYAAKEKELRKYWAAQEFPWEKSSSKGSKKP